MNNLTFIPITKHQPGTIFSLLSRSYAPIWNDELEEKMRQADREVFENPQTVGACTFITCLDARPIGMASYDPRPAPELAIIGHTCILPNYQHRGFGRQQIAEILRRLKAQGFAKVTVTTSDHPFFILAQKMYQACGFKELRRFKQTPHSECQTIEYSIDLKPHPGAPGHA
ncbi:MAG: GNAT family N-acetyltransferase [Phycisphaerae bacterium]|nr:GNAT family N-acetyltransferase [Phycisphaerae bacterium]